MTDNALDTLEGKVYAERLRLELDRLKQERALLNEMHNRMSGGLEIRQTLGLFLAGAVFALLLLLTASAIGL